jgi:hypothetical protein
MASGLQPRFSGCPLGQLGAGTWPWLEKGGGLLRSWSRSSVRDVELGLRNDDEGTLFVSLFKTACLWTVKLVTRLTTDSPHGHSCSPLRLLISALLDHDCFQNRPSSRQ